MQRRSSVPYAMFGVVLAWLLVRAIQVGHFGWGTGFDVHAYERYARQWGGGGAPYVSFQPEYPPGALLVFLLPYLFSGAKGYVRAFQLEMAVFDLAACVLLVQCVRTLRPGRWDAALFAAGLYLFATAALHPVLYMRFDLAPAAITLAAVYCAHRRKDRSSSLLLGIAGAVKLWPFVLAPLWLGFAFRRRGWARAVSTALWIGAGALLAAAPTLPRAGAHVLGFLKYHEARGIQIETTWSTLALVLNAAGITEVHPAHNYGAFHLSGPIASFFASISMPALLAGVLLPQAIVLYRILQGRDGAQPSLEATQATFNHAVVATVVGFMIAGKVLSPQFMLWIVPLWPLVVRGSVGGAAVLSAAVLTTVVYPYLAPALEQRAPGHGWALLSVGARNLILIGWYAVLVRRCSGLPRPVAASATARSP